MGVDAPAPLTVDEDRYPMTPRQRSTLVQELKCQRLYMDWAIRQLELGVALDKCTDSSDIRYVMRSLHTDITHS